MDLSLADKARAGRRAALSALNARLATDDRVVSIFEGSFPRRGAVPQFHSVRTGAGPRRAPGPRIAAGRAAA